MCKVHYHRSTYQLTKYHQINTLCQRLTESGNLGLKSWKRRKVASEVKAGEVASASLSSSQCAFLPPKIALLFPELVFYFPELPFCFPEGPLCFLELPLCFPELLFTFPEESFYFLSFYLQRGRGHGSNKKNHPQLA